MKVMLFFDQVQAGYGGKENRKHPLTIDSGGVGSATMLQPHLNKVGGNIIATISVGDLMFFEDPDTNSKKIAAMAKKIGADVVLCGPCFDYDHYAKMASYVCKVIEEKTGIPAIAAMSKENRDIIDEYKDSVSIIKMPKKGGTGLSKALDDIAEALKNKYEGRSIEEDALYD